MIMILFYDFDSVPHEFLNNLPVIFSPLKDIIRFLFYIYIESK